MRPTTICAASVWLAVTMAMPSQAAESGRGSSPDPLAAVAAGQAIDGRRTPEYLACIADARTAESADSAIYYCAVKEADRQKAKLAETYEAVLGRLSASRKRALVASQRAWEASLDAMARKIERSSSTDGRVVLGAFTVIAEEYYVLSETIKRTIWLERFH